jgi:hypothetical protein
MALWVPSIDCAEMHGSPISEQQTLMGGFTATRKWKCAWGSRFALMNELLTWPGAAYDSVSQPQALAREATAVSFPGEQQGSGKTGAYEFAIVTATFRTPTPGTPQSDPGPGGDNFVISEAIAPTAEFMTVDPTGLRWKTMNRALENGEAPGRMEVGFIYVFTRYNWVATPQQLIDALSLVGCTNAEAIDATLLGIIFPPESLLFLEPSLQTETRADGVRTTTATFRFAYKGITEAQPGVPPVGGWNQFWCKKLDSPHGGKGWYDKIIYKTGQEETDYKNYPVRSFLPARPATP